MNSPWLCGWRESSWPSHKEAVLAVTKGGNVLRLEVDQQSNHTLGPAPATWANTLVPLHLGGLPGECSLSLGAGGGGRLPRAPGAEVEWGAQA